MRFSPRRSVDAGGRSCSPLTEFGPEQSHLVMLFLLGQDSDPTTLALGLVTVQLCDLVAERITVEGPRRHTGGQCNDTRKIVVAFYALRPAKATQEMATS